MNSLHLINRFIAENDRETESAQAIKHSINLLDEIYDIGNHRSFKKAIQALDRIIGADLRGKPYMSLSSMKEITKNRSDDISTVVIELSKLRGVLEEDIAQNVIDLSICTLSVMLEPTTLTTYTKSASSHIGRTR